jgi:excisionase family DNA binding protein
MSERVAADPDALLTAEQVARILGVTPGWVYAQSRHGLIPTVTLGRYRRYRREAIDAWLRGLERNGTAPDVRRHRARDGRPHRGEVEDTG